MRNSQHMIRRRTTACTRTPDRAFARSGAREAGRYEQLQTKQVAFQDKLTARSLNVRKYCNERYWRCYLLF
jgi:hypothetical protein